VDNLILAAVAPIVFLLALAIAAAVGSRAFRASPIVGYLALGVALNSLGINLVESSESVAVLAQLGVVFLLFDIGLHFSLSHIREQARDIFGFGPLQVLFGTAVLALPALALGMAPLAAVLTGAILALSSTAVVARLVAERHQQNCPVGLTATAILIFQDVAGIFLLIIAGSLEGKGGLLPAMGLALVKALLAFAAAVVIAKVAVRPLFDLVARTGAEEVFTATALVIALAAGWATGSVGLSLTLGAFLGGVTLAETPYRATVAAEIKPFRGLLLGFFFIAVGGSLDIQVLAHEWPAIIGITAGMLTLKIFTNAAASLVFRWSVPGSTQLAFLLAQGSEFAFVVLSLPAIRHLIGEARCSLLVAAVALSLALTPALAGAGRQLAGSLRRRAAKARDRELEPRVAALPVLIVGMGRRGRALADALSNFGVGYSAVERDPHRLSEAVADGYAAVFGNMADPRLWEPVAGEGRRFSILTAPSFDESSELTYFAHATHPTLKRVAVVPDESNAERFRGIGIACVIDSSDPPGVDLCTYVLAELGIDGAQIAAWNERQRTRLTETVERTQRLIA
jgi:Kef-type K+ transport system membrane component KefB